MAEIVPSIKNEGKRTQVELMKMLMIIRRKMTSVHLLHFETKWAVAGTD